MRISRRTASAALTSLLALSSFIPEGGAAYAYEPVVAEIPVACFEVGDERESLYNIKIEPLSEDAPAPLSGGIEIAEDGEGSFSIEINEPGTFVYRIYQEPGDDADIEYDANVYLVTAFVENAEDDTLIYAVSASIEGADDKSDSVDFKNISLRGDHEVTTSAPAGTTVVTTYTTAATATEAASSAEVPTTSAPTAGGSDNPVADFIDNVLTGDNFPARALRTVLGVSMLAAIVAFLFRRKAGEEDDE